jgi:hypothetical protein
MRGLSRLSVTVAAAGLSAAGILTLDAIAGPRATSRLQKTGDEARAIFSKEAARDAWSWLLRPHQEFRTPSLSEVLELKARLPS